MPTKARTTKKSLYQNLNYLSKLTNQLAYLRDPGDRPVRIAYSSSGVPTAALIADTQAILDYTLFQVTCSNLNEAYYLLAIINSDALASEVNRFMPKGLFGARHLQKHLWKLPIPTYDPNNAEHLNLSRLARACHRRSPNHHRQHGHPSTVCHESARRSAS